MANVTGPVSSTDTAIPRWNGTSGTVIQDSSVTIDGSNNIAGLNSISSDGGDFSSDGSGNVTLTSLTALTINGGSISPTANTITFATGGGGILGLDNANAGNTIFGQYSALPTGGSGSYANTGIGQGACGGMTAANAHSNTAIGALTASIISGNNNITIGALTMRYLTSGGNNTVVGTKSFGNSSATSAANNSVLGYNSGENATTATNNVIVGDNTAASLVAGSQNILIGSGVDLPGATDGSNMLNIGGAITGSLTTGPALMNGFTATTQSSGDNSTKIATTAYVNAATSGLAPSASPTFTGTLLAASINASGAVTGGVVSLSIVSGAIATNAALGNYFYVHLASGSTTMSAPSNDTDGQVITYELEQPSSGSAGTVSWNSAFDFGGSGAPSLSTTNGDYDLVGFRYSARKSKWLYLGSLLGF